MKIFGRSWQHEPVVVLFQWLKSLNAIYALIQKNFAHLLLTAHIHTNVALQLEITFLPLKTKHDNKRIDHSLFRSVANRLKTIIQLIYSNGSCLTTCAIFHFSFIYSFLLKVLNICHMPVSRLFIQFDNYYV